MSAHRLLLGTHTSNQAQNYIQIAQVEVPEEQEDHSVTACLSVPSSRYLAAFTGLY